MRITGDRIKETTTTTGVGALALAGTLTGFRRFNAIASIGDTFHYAMEGVNVDGTLTGEWEVGIGTYSGLNTLTRSSILSSSNGGAAVNFSAGTKQVWIDAPAAHVSAPWFNSQPAGVDYDAFSGNFFPFGTRSHGHSMLNASDYSGFTVYREENDTGTTQYAVGSYGAAVSVRDATLQTSLWGVEGDAYHRGNINTTFVGGMLGYSEHNGTGTASIVCGVAGQATRQSGAGTASIMASLYAQTNVRAAGTVSLNAGVYIEDQAGIGTNNWSLYAVGSAPSFFGGDVQLNDGLYTTWSGPPGANQGALLIWGTLSGVSQCGVTMITAGTASGTSEINTLSIRTDTNAAAFTAALTSGIHIYNGSKGAGSTITEQVGVYVNDLTVGATNYAYVGQVSAGNGYNLMMSGTAPNYLARALGIGQLPISVPNVALCINMGIMPDSGGTAAGVYLSGGFTTGVTTTGAGQWSDLSTQAAAYTITNLIHYYAATTVQGAGSTITNTMGFYAGDWTGGNNRYGFYGVLSRGINKYNLYMLGSALNYLRGNLSIGATGPQASMALYVSTAAGDTTGTTQYGLFNNPEFNNSATSEGIGVYSAPATAATAFTQAVMTGYLASGIKGAGSTVTTWVGFDTHDIGLGVTNIAYRGILSAGTNKYNLYMSGTAWNYIAGNIAFGGSGPSADRQVNIITSQLTGAGQYGIVTQVIASSTATGESFAYYGANGTAAASFTIGQIAQFLADNANKGAGSTITELNGFCCRDLTSGGTNIAFRGGVTAGANKYNLYMSGTASNFLAGDTAIERSASGATVELSCSNTNSASATADVRVRIASNGASGGDPYLHWSINGVQDWTMGPDNSDSDSFVGSRGSALGTNNWLRVNTSGVVTLFTNSRATIDLTTQSAAIGSTLLYAVPASDGGMYEITWVATVTRAATTSSTLGGTAGFQIDYTDFDTSVSKLTPQQGAPTAGQNQTYGQTNQANTTAAQISGVIVVYAAASSNINYRIGYTSSGATTMQYNLHIKIRKIS